MSNCVVGCKTRTKPKLKCRTCLKEFHEKCVNVSETDLGPINTGAKLWICCDCSKKVQTNDDRNLVPPLASTLGNIHQENEEPTLRNLLNEIREIRKEQGTTLRSVEYLQTEIIEMRKVMDKIEADLKKKEETIVKATEELSILRKENQELKDILNETDQFTKINCLEITGVPVVGRSEDVFATAQTLAAGVGFSLQDNMVDCCYRKRSTNLKPQLEKSIVIRFLKNSDKQELLRCRKIRRNYSTKDLNTEFISKYVKQHDSIYFNDVLTNYNRILFYKAKQFQKDNSIKFLWTKNGNIFMRKNEESNIIKIKSNRSFTDAL